MHNHRKTFILTLLISRVIFNAIFPAHYDHLNNDYIFHLKLPLYFTNAPLVNAHHFVQVAFILLMTD